MQLHELEAWLGDNHGLDEEQVADLLALADEIQERYPETDERGEASAALTTAYRLMAEGPDSVIAELAAARAAARNAEIEALAGLRQAALQLIPRKERTEAGLARECNVDRMTVRSWLGK